jgi:hypothetical protein
VYINIQYLPSSGGFERLFFGSVALSSSSSSSSSSSLLTASMATFVTAGLDARIPNRQRRAPSQVPICKLVDVINAYVVNRLLIVVCL